MVLANQIYVAKEGLHAGLRNRLLRLAAFQNPEFYKTQAMRLSTYDKPRVIACAEDHPQHIGLPRGCLDDLRQTLTDVGVHTVIRDERYAGRPLDVSFKGELRPEQKVAAKAMLAHEIGVLAATTAFGKTVVAAPSPPHLTEITLIVYVLRKAPPSPMCSSLLNLGHIEVRVPDFSARCGIQNGNR